MTVIDEFVKQYKSDLSKEHIRTICESPFLVLKECMKGPVLKSMRFSLLGIFQVSYPKVRHFKSLAEKNHSEGILNTITFNQRMETFEKTLEDEFKEY